MAKLDGNAITGTLRSRRSRSGSRTEDLLRQSTRKKEQQRHETLCTEAGEPGKHHRDARPVDRDDKYPMKWASNQDVMPGSAFSRRLSGKISKPHVGNSVLVFYRRCSGRVVRSEERRV